MNGGKGLLWLPGRPSIAVVPTKPGSRTAVLPGTVSMPVVESHGMVTGFLMLHRGSRKAD